MIKFFETNHNDETISDFLINPIENNNNNKSKSEDASFQIECQICHDQFNHKQNWNNHL